VLVVLAVIGVLLYLVSPVLDGYHFGYNSATDNSCLSRVFQWCQYDPSLGPPGLP
jgi:hypothetical protein